MIGVALLGRTLANDSTTTSSDPAVTVTFHTPVPVAALYRAQMLYVYAVAVQYAQAVATPEPTAVRAPVLRDIPEYTAGGDESAGWQKFLAGYHDAAGPEQWLTGVLAALDGCEGSQWTGYHGYNSYWTRAQFSLDTWAKVVAHYQIQDIQEMAADDSYFVGKAVGWWVRQVSDVPAQWPHCFGGRH